MKCAYLDCFSGISGDMMVGALIDAGLPIALLREELLKLPLHDYELVVEPVRKSGISAANFTVRVDDKKQCARDYRSIREMLEASSLNDHVKALSLRIFHLLAVAEGKIHAVPPEKVHFHEVGGVDSIIDIVSTAIGIDHLHIGTLHASDIVTGSGMVMTEHGNMPIPAPATAELLKGVPLSGTDIKGELVTPTGAAILKAVVTNFGVMPKMNTETIGYGAGDKVFDARPNLLRLLIGEAAERPGDEGLENFEGDEILVMETAIDDMNPQYFDDMAEQLFAAGALDVVMIPVYMKKGRPGTLLQVILSRENRGAMAGIIFSCSTAIGIRTYGAGRIKLKRESRIISTPLGELKVKAIWKADERVELRPEYDELKRVARQTGLSVKEVSEKIQEAVLLKK